MEIMQEINDRMMQSPMPDYEPYVRPVGAFLVGECVPFMAINELDIPSRNYLSSDQIVSSGTVLAGNEVTFDAKNSIMLSAGFHVPDSSNFTAIIGGCDIETGRSTKGEFSKNDIDKIILWKNNLIPIKYKK